jgi:hypothetical protein
MSVCSVFVLSVFCLAVGASGTCDVTGSRDPCGFIGVNQTSCESLGCCWEESSAPYCFLSTPTPPPSPSPYTSTGSYVFLITLIVAD